MGLVRVYLGLESGCQASLDLLGKGVTVDCNARSLALLDELDIVADFRCLLFHPWSTLETIRADLTFLEQALPFVPTPLTFHEVECYPGTPLMERLRAESPGAGEQHKEKAWTSPNGDYGRLAEDLHLAYAIADRRAELLRRLGRVVFGARHAERGIHQQISQAWYDILLQRRFQPEQPLADTARALRETVDRLNHDSLAIWREMLSFADSGHLHDASSVNECTSGWAKRVNTLDMTVQEGLGRL
jgi:hypothetical protein